MYNIFLNEKVQDWNQNIKWYDNGFGISICNENYSIQIKDIVAQNLLQDDIYSTSGTATM